MEKAVIRPLTHRREIVRGRVVVALKISILYVWCGVLRRWLFVHGPSWQMFYLRLAVSDLQSLAVEMFVINRN